jgi:hypothetical protein
MNYGASESRNGTGINANILAAAGTGTIWRRTTYGAVATMGAVTCSITGSPFAQGITERRRNTRQYFAK